MKKIEVKEKDCALILSPDQKMNFYLPKMGKDDDIVPGYIQDMAVIAVLFNSGDKEFFDFLDKKKEELFGTEEEE